MRWSDQCSSALLRNLGTEVRIIGSDNWVVQNLENALEVWNGKLSEIWQSRETHPFLRSEFSMIEGEEEFIPYPSRQKPSRKKEEMER